MSHAEVCPICGGSGRLPISPITTGNNTKICHGCNGKGWIEVADTFVPSPTPCPVPYHPQVTWFYVCGSPTTKRSNR